MASLVHDLNALHDTYVAAVNRAVAGDDLERADRLAAEYGEDAVTMITEFRERRTDR